MKTFGPISKEAAAYFSERLVRWWRRAARQFRWRKTDDVYELLIAELLLRRTNARAVEQVYDAFLDRYPNKILFGNAKSRDLRQLLKPLGLAWRAENIVTLSKHLKQSDCEIPQNLSELESLPGVGPYVARAVLVNAIGLKTVAVDSNVVRVICRYIGLEPTDSLRRQKAFQLFADSLVNQSSPKELNYALLDLASLICRPQNPKCQHCPLLEKCCFAQHEKQKEAGCQEGKTGHSGQRKNQRG
ncbi:MAG: hypothetical protein JSS83_20975 [Cyanobacteria bacterium SZAS LIN-3]|nr:hypothetical protein [Cyanobacteria bacterium SZAS LIN-3]